MKMLTTDKYFDEMSWEELLVESKERMKPENISAYMEEIGLIETSPFLPKIGCDIRIKRPQ